MSAQEEYDRDRRIFERGKTLAPLREQIAEIASFFADVDEPLAVMKVGEECGEVMEAYIGLTGANPRKGVTADRQKVVKELCDVIVTAFTALHSFSGDPFAALSVRAAEVIERHHASVVSANQDVPEPTKETQ